MLALLSCCKSETPLTTRVANLTTKNYENSQTQLSVFAGYRTVGKTLSQFEQYLAEHWNTPIDKARDTNSRYKSHKSSHSTKISLTQNYVSACMFIFSSLNRENTTSAVPVREYIVINLYLFLTSAIVD